MVYSLETPVLISNRSFLYVKSEIKEWEVNNKDVGAVLNEIRFTHTLTTRKKIENLRKNICFQKQITLS